MSLKVLCVVMKDLFNRSVSTISQLSHLNVIELSVIGYFDNNSYMVATYITYYYYCCSLITLVFSVVNPF